MPTPDPRTARRAWLLAVLPALLLPPSGCGVVPKSRLDAATKVVKSLRDENAQLKDTTLSLKGENVDLSQRALDDSRKLATLEAANTRLESSVQGYIDERENLNDAFLRFKRQAQASAAAAPSTAMQGRLKSFAVAHEGTVFDPSAGTISIEADRLFLPGTDRLRPEAARWLLDCAAILAEPEAREWPLVVAGHAADSAVRLASTDVSKPELTPADLSLARAVKVRNALAERAGRDPSRIGVAGLGTSRPVDAGADDRGRPRNARIELELAPPGAPSAP